MRALRDWPRFDPAKSAAQTFVTASLKYGLKDAVRVARGASRLIIERVSAGGDGTSSESGHITAIDARSALSLSRPLSLSPPEGTKAEAWCAVEVTHEGFADVDNRDKILQLLARAFPGHGRGPMKERLIFLLYYFEDLTMREIGATLGLSESRVCQLHTRGLGRLAEAARASC